MTPLLSDAAFAATALSTLLDLSIKAGVILAVAGVLTSLLRKREAAVRHTIWLSAVAGILVLPFAGALLPQWNVLPGTMPTLAVSDAAPVPVEQTAPLTAGPETKSASKAGDTSPVGAVPSESIASEPVAAPVGASPFAIVLDAISTVRSLHWTVLLFWIWVGGVMAVMAHLLVGALGLYRVTRRARVVHDPEWIDLLEEIGDRLWITRDVVLLRSHRTTMPLTWGGRRPVILLPSDADSWDDERRRYVLTHEMAHIKRWDCTTQGIAQLACALYWFNPLVWAASRRLRIERERACDDQVIATGGRPSSYAQHLLEIARSLKATLASPLGAVAMARPSQLEGRVLAILDPDRSRRSVRKGHALFASVGMLAFVLPLAALSPAEALNASERPTSEVEAVNPAVAAANGGSVADFAANDAAEMWSVETSGGQRLKGLKPSRLSTVPAMEPEAWRSDPLSAALPDTTDKERRRAALVKAFTEALEDEDEGIRRQAAHMLGELDDAAAIPALRRVAENDRSTEVRSAATYALAELDDPSAIPSLARQLENESDSDLRRRIVWMIGEHADDGDAAAGRALMSALGDSDSEVRSTAVWALAEMEYAPALSQIAELLDDSDSEVRARSIRAIAEMADDAPSDALIASLERAMRADDTDVRQAAAYALGELEDHRATGVLADALSDEDPEVRERAAWALGEIEDAAAVSALANALQSDTNEGVRQAAAYALGEIETDEALRALAGAIDDTNNDVRRHALYALAELEDPAALDVLIKASRDDDSHIRRIAISALGDLEDDRAASRLIEVTRDEDPDLRRLAIWSLSELDATDAIIAALRRSLTDEDAEVRRATVHALAEFEDEGSLSALIEALSDENEEVRRAAAHAVGEYEDKSAVPALIDVVTNDPSEEVRRAAAYSLGEIGSTDAIEALTGAMKDSNPEVRRAATSALQSIDWDDDEDDGWDDHDWDHDDQNGNHDDDRSHYDNSDWDDNVNLDLRINGIEAHVGHVASEIGMVIGEATGLALESAGVALRSIDIDDLVGDITIAVDDAQLDDVMESFVGQMADMGMEIGESVNQALIESLVCVIEDDPKSREARKARRALERMDHPQADRELRRLR